MRTLVRLLRHHPDTLHADAKAAAAVAGTMSSTTIAMQSSHRSAFGGTPSSATVHTIAVALTRHVRNLRSQVSRAACQAATELYGSSGMARQHRDHHHHPHHPLQLEPADSDELALALLNRTADTNRFLRADAQQALDMMCDRGAPVRVFAVLLQRGCTHANAVVRTQAARLCARTTKRVGADRMMAGMQGAAGGNGDGLSRELRDRVVLAAARLLQEGSLETRRHAKEMCAVLAQHPTWERVMTEAVPAKVLRNIEKQLRGLK